MDIYLRSGQFNLLSMSVSADGGDGWMLSWRRIEMIGQ